MNKINKIVFYHNHVNGDCFQSRILVNQIIKETKNFNIEYYYSAPKAICSHSFDLGISEDNFNKYSCKEDKLVYSIDNDILFINIHIGLLDNFKCAFCLKDLIKNNNVIISEINKIINTPINYINENINPYLNFNYSFYDCDFLESFIIENKNIYEKIILIYNLIPTTFHVYFNHNIYLENIAYKNYLFITFNETNLNIKNIISIKNIYDLYNKQLPLSYGIEFSFLSLISDKVVLLPSGASLMSFNNQNLQNKFIIFINESINNNPHGAPFCVKNNTSDHLCTRELGWNVSILRINTDNLLFENIIKSLLNFFEL